jgi:hypothetical protein
METSHMLRRLLSQPLLVGLVALSGCAEATDTDTREAGSPLPVDAITGDIDQTATADIGPEGGALDTDFGVSATFPAGALLERTTITVVWTPTPNGPALRFEPMGLKFEEPVLVDLPAVDEFRGDDLTIALLCYAVNLDGCLVGPNAFDGRLHPWLVNAVGPIDEMAAPDPANRGSFGAPTIAE